MMRVRDVMVEDVVQISEMETAQAAAERMRHTGVGFLPVVASGRLVGVLTDRDITVRVTAEGRDAGATPVSDVMTAALVTCDPDAPLAEAAAIMGDQAVHRLPIVDEHRRLVGLITLDDLARVQGEAKHVAKALHDASTP